MDMDPSFLPINDVSDWETLETQVVYDNPWITVEHHEVRTPAQTKGIYGLVRFKNKAIGIVPVDSDNHVYLVGQFRYPLNAYSWEIPEGGGPHEEDPLVAAKRELKEETGLIAQEWRKIGVLHTSNSVTDEEGILYLATGLSQSESEPEETESLAVQKVALKQAVEWVVEGKITDSLAVAGILLAARHLGI
jgi:8-oxo-dGTP pyrophosphatase MutT (NUDIX family)